MDYSDILHRCFRCGYCKMPENYMDVNCPSYLNFRFETYSPGGRLWLLRALLDGEINTSPRLAEIMFSCAACGNCVEHCVFPKFKDDILKALIAGRGELVERGAVPPAARDYFKAVHVNGNPYKLPEEQRAAWLEGLEADLYNGQEYLLFVGDAGAFDERAVKMTQAVAVMLNKLGVSFGVLGKNETCDGNEALVMGENGLFELLAMANINKFNELGVKKIIVVSPHSLHALKNEYPALGGDFEVFHYTQIMAGLMEKAGSGNGKNGTRVVFHDPCYLGRHNKEYRAPRVLLSKTPGVSLMEMDRYGKNALCCGGGGGNFFTDIIGSGPDAPSRVRIREALEQGAEILAVACPKCLRMLSDAAKAEEADDRIKVMDAAELALSHLR